MHTLEHYDNQIPEDIHKEAYRYIQTLDLQSRLRHLPNANNSEDDLTPYVAKKTAYMYGLGHNYEVLQKHTPIGILFAHINSTLFNNKFEFNGKVLGMTPKDQIPLSEVDDYAAEKEFKGSSSCVVAQPYETVKRTRIPHRDWDDAPLDSDQYYTIAFIANLVWSPLWHAEMFFYNDATHDDTTVNFTGVTHSTTTNTIGWSPEMRTNMPGRVILYDSRLLHSSRATSILAPELAQRIEFRVKLKEGETHV